MTPKNFLIDATSCSGERRMQLALKAREYKRRLATEISPKRRQVLRFRIFVITSVLDNLRVWTDDLVAEFCQTECPLDFRPFSECRVIKNYFEYGLGVDGTGLPKVRWYHHLLPPRLSRRYARPA